MYNLGIQEISETQVANTIFNTFDKWEIIELICYFIAFEAHNVWFTITLSILIEATGIS